MSKKSFEEYTKMKSACTFFLMPLQYNYRDTSSYIKSANIMYTLVCVKYIFSKAPLFVT